MPQGKSLNIGVKKLPIAGVPSQMKPDPIKVSAESDERYQYLLKRAIIRRVENDERIIFAELPGLPGVLVMYRKPSERYANPERLNLDRRDLTQMPLLEGEDKLRLLNYQHNFITKIENLLSLPNLIFLDLYNNQIKEINGLQTVPTLRVLMLGKNQIDKIKNLNSLTKLDVLDLHSNRIGRIENLAVLHELRVLNLANNQICLFENLESLVSLTELNLRRNLIEIVRPCPLHKLQRLFLSNNRLEKQESIEGLAVFSSLLELALDGNPIHHSLSYPACILNRCPQVTHLDLKKVSSDMKETSKPIKIEEPSTNSESLISVISQEWRLEVERLKSLGLDQFKRRKETANDSVLQSGHAEIEGESTLFIYGNALEVLTKAEFQDTVHSIHFLYVKFSSLTQNSLIFQLKKFTGLKKIVLSDNNFNSFIQFSKFEALTGLKSIQVENNESNFCVLFRSFAVYRFIGIEEINSEKVDENDKTRARECFQNFDRILCGKNILVEFI
jgi:leucine-rich repeat-containing protein 49